MPKKKTGGLPVRRLNGNIHGFGHEDSTAASSSSSERGSLSIVRLHGNVYGFGPPQVSGTSAFTGEHRSFDILEPIRSGHSDGMPPTPRIGPLSPVDTPPSFHLAGQRLGGAPPPRHLTPSQMAAEAAARRLESAQSHQGTSLSPHPMETRTASALSSSHMESLDDFALDAPSPFSLDSAETTHSMHVATPPPDRSEPARMAALAAMRRYESTKKKEGGGGD